MHFERVTSGLFGRKNLDAYEHIQAEKMRAVTNLVLKNVKLFKVAHIPHLYPQIRPTPLFMAPG